MSKKVKIDTDVIGKKLKKLESVKKSLKKEFVGIDRQIDQMVESIKVWFIFPETLNKPLIVNLWGITGTFKTSVIRRLVALLELNDKFKEIDSRKILNSTIRDIIGTDRNLDDPTVEYPTLFLLDEFQNIRTISNRGDDTESSNELYELFAWLSDGKIKYTRNAYHFSKMKVLVEKIKTDRRKLISDMLTKRYRKAEMLKQHLSKNAATQTLQDMVREDTQTLTEVFWDDNYRTLEEYHMFNYTMITSFDEDLSSLFDFILENFKNITLDFTLDLSKSLIFIAGNVDEAFAGLTHNMDNEMLTPDQFYEISSQVNFNVIKESLLYRFKPEQVARLGTNHIIFPSFNTKMYTKFIERLNKRTIGKFTQFGVKIDIDETVTEFILTHAAIPSQGSRSVLSAHEYLVDSNIPEALAKSLLTKGKRVTIGIKDDHVVIVTNKEIIVKEITIIDKNVLENYNNHDLNHTISLHEAGHAIVGIAVMGILPDMIKTRLSNGDVGGYCKFSPEEGIMTRNEAIGQLALAMGGYAAETIRKGFDNVSTGSSSDILSATGLAAALVKVLGLGSGISASGFSMGRDGLVLYNNEELEKEVEQLVEEGLMLAFMALSVYDKEHKALTKILMNQPTTRAKDIPLF
jgi:cell division protease FtsH